MHSDVLLLPGNLADAAALGTPEVIARVRVTPEVAGGPNRQHYPTLNAHTGPGGMLRELAKSDSRILLFYCASSKRSVMAVKTVQAAGLPKARHIRGGLDAWRKAGDTTQ